MNAIHLHLLITHLPILGTLIAALLLGLGIFFDQMANRKAAYALLIICGIAAFVSSASGEQSELILQHYPQFDPKLMDAHQKYAGTAFVWAVIIALMSILSWWFEIKGQRFLRLWRILLLILVISNFCLLSWVGYEGGKISHQEVLY
jgi:uncharacterized membrane protein